MALEQARELHETGNHDAAVDKAAAAAQAVGLRLRYRNARPSPWLGPLFQD